MAKTKSTKNTQSKSQESRIKIQRGGLGKANALDNPPVKGSGKRPCRNA